MTHIQSTKRPTTARRLPPQARPDGRTRPASAVTKAIRTATQPRSIKKTSDNAHAKVIDANEDAKSRWLGTSTSFGLKTLFQTETTTLWEQGDKLRGADSATIKLLAQWSGRDVTTLVLREKVARMFPVASKLKPGQLARNTNIFWGVFAALATSVQPAQQAAIFASQEPETWTPTAMRAAIQATKTPKVLDDVDAAVAVGKGGMKLGGIPVKGARLANGDMQLRVEADAADVIIRHEGGATIITLKFHSGAIDDIREGFDGLEDASS